jgi:hypothetical protein
VKLAQQPNTPPELRQQLFQMAREWMQAMMAEEEEDEIATPKCESRCLGAHKVPLGGLTPP